jgi:hypothetical protein
LVFPAAADVTLLVDYYPLFAALLRKQRSLAASVALAGAHGGQGWMIGVVREDVSKSDN